MHCTRWVPKLNLLLFDYPSVSLYDAALQLATTDTKVELVVNLTRRLGNVKNELGVFYMDKAASLLDSSSEPSNEERELWKKSFSNFDSGIRTFDVTDDRFVLNIMLFKKTHIKACLHWRWSWSRRSVSRSVSKNK